MSNNSVAVYAPGFKFVLHIPAEKVHHMPPTALNVTRLVLCANYDARHAQTSCPMGNRCKFVHADVQRVDKHAIHVNYAWRALTNVTYERYPAGQVLHVAPPNSKVPTDIMDADMALKTRALTSKRRPLSHCAHYYFNRTCNLGAECQFIHAIFIDPTAKDHQRAPVPSQLGEGRELQLSKKQRESRQRLALDAVSRLPREHGSPMPPSMSQSIEPCGLSEAASLCLTPREHEVPTPASSSASACSHSRARFRHDPYSLTATRVITFHL
jgi:hypothetical protein